MNAEEQRERHERVKGITERGKEGEGTVLT
jgi:hypothetical protein